MEHPPYSPGLAPSDYCLVPKIKKHLRRLRFSSDEYLKGAVKDLSKEFFSRHKAIYYTSFIRQTSAARSGVKQTSATKKQTVPQNGL
jgi:hypothetical protein